jgi:hypothetical protein
VARIEMFGGNMSEQSESEETAPPTIAPATSMDVAGVVVLGTYLITQFLRGRWDTVTLPAASILTILSGSGNFLIGRWHKASIEKETL